MLYGESLYVGRSMAAGDGAGAAAAGDGAGAAAAAADAAADALCLLRLDQANRHGLVAGASGTGKTVTMKQMAQGFSQAGVPVFLADAKGDVSGMCEPGTMSDKLQASLEVLGLSGEGAGAAAASNGEDAAADVYAAEGAAAAPAAPEAAGTSNAEAVGAYAAPAPVAWSFEGCPCRFWNMLGGDGIPVRIRVSDMGPSILARLLGLSDVQEGVLNIVFRVADDKGLLLIDLKDLRAMLTYVADNADELKATYGLASAQSIAAIQRSLLAVEDQGGTLFFGEPALELADWMACDEAGYGYVNILDATKLVNSPQVYAMFLLWMMGELFDTLPEAGDLAKPRFVFFFDEAHLLFNNMPQELLDKFVQVVKLIRSKGVGMYFVTQSPGDVPDAVLAQLSNRVQHGLRAYTPGEQKAVRAAAEGFRPNPAFDAATAINELGTGEALVSFLDGNGTPGIVQRAKIVPCQCAMGAASPEARAHAVAAADGLMAKYGTAIDAQSAYEDLAEQARAAAESATTWFCPECKKAVSGKFCSECGTARPEDVELADTAAKAKAQEKAVAAQVKEAERSAKEAARAEAKAAKEAAAAEKAEAREKEKAAKAKARIVADVAGAAARMVGVPSSVVTAGKSVIRNGGDAFARGILGNLLK